ncbi:MAG: PEGA domain-containing protein [Myxococcota bacterium]
MSPSKPSVGRLALIGLVAFVPATLFAAPRAHAAKPDEDEPSLAIFEIYYTGQNFEKTPEYALKVEERLTKIGGFAVVARADAEKSIAEKIPASADEAVAEQADEIHKEVKDAEDVFFNDGPEKALDKILKAKERLQQIVNRNELSERIRKEYVTAQLLLALVYLRANSADKATEVMEELVQRVGEDPTINEDNYHPDVVALYHEVYKNLSTKRVAKITVRTNPPGADVYINGQVQERKTPATFEGLYPGKVTIQVKKDDRASRVKEVRLEEGTTAELDIDLNFESALAFGNKRFGLVFRNAEDRKRNLPQFASKLGEFVQADYIAFVGIGEEDGKTGLEGYLVNTQNDALLRGTSLAARPNAVSKNRIESMAYFILYGEEPKPVYKPWYTNTLGWVLTGVGVVGGGVGALFYSSYSSDKKIAECDPAKGACEQDYRGRLDAKSSAETERTVAFASWGVGAAALIGGIVAFAAMDEEDLDAPVKPKIGGAKVKTTQVVPTPVILPDGSLGVGVGLTF